MKNLILKYCIEFSVIVLGISVSFWFDKYQISLDNLDREKEIISELATELDKLGLRSIEAGEIIQKVSRPKKISSVILKIF